jgi:2TM domain-containing protein
MSDAFDRAADRADHEERRRRRERSAHGQRKAFRIHATVFVAVQILLVVVWVLQWQLGGTGHPWFLYALTGWGVGLAAHYATIRDSFKGRWTREAER